MKIIRVIVLTIVASGVFGACSVESEKPTSKVQAKPRSTFLDAQVDSMKKAERVEDTVLKADQERKSQMQDL